MEMSEIAEMLETLGYEGKRFDAMKGFIAEWSRRKALISGGCLSVSDVVMASFIFDAYNKRQAREK